MKRLDDYRIFILSSVFLFSLTVSSDGQTVTANERPIADAGLLRYAGIDPVRLDGSRSHDPDNSGNLSYTWRQTDGPTVFIIDADTATPTVCGSLQPGTAGRDPKPTVGGFAQTDTIQPCEFELVVSDGELTSIPDTVTVIIVPDYGPETLQQENPPFKADKPTMVYFGGGDCVEGLAYLRWGSWHDLANVVSFPQGYRPDPMSSETWHTYYHYADMLIVYLSRVAPNYTQPIQTMGWSTGGQPAVDTGIRLNRFYNDPRYAVNRVTQLDAPCRWGFQSQDVYMAANALLVASGVEGEPCWLEHYWGDDWRLIDVPHNLLGVYLQGHDHAAARDWYRDSLTTAAANQFNHGVIAGAYWSVIGPGKNLQLTRESVGHYFRWSRDEGMTLFDEAAYPGRLPEPVILGAWVSISDVSGDVDGVVLSCYESENAVGYELLLGPDPYRVAHYEVVSDTPAPPMDIIRELPSEETWWTVRVRDQYGSTLYADPVRLDPAGLPALTVENARTRKRYGPIAHAILDAEPDDMILLYPATYDESIEFGGKTLTISSLDPNTPSIVAATVIRGWDSIPPVSFSGPESAACMLAGLTIQSETVGVSCRDAAPPIQNCVIESPNGVAVEFWHGYEPQLIDCTLLGQVREGGDPGLIAYWKLDETEGNAARESVNGSEGMVVGSPLWQPAGGRVDGALELDGIDDYVRTTFRLDPAESDFSVFAWIKGGAAAQVIVSQQGGVNWLMADAIDGALRTDLREAAGGGRSPTPPGPPLISPSVVTDGQWHRVGLVRNGSDRILYVDDVEVARDTATNLEAASGTLRIGAGSNLEPDAFWSGLVDDVRIYTAALSVKSIERLAN